MNVYLPFTVRLPSEYQEVEWIETTWTQFINTWLFPWNNIQTETKIEVTTTDQNIPVFWWYTTWNVAWMSTHYHLTPYWNSWYFWLNGSESHWWTYSTVVWTQYTIVYNNSNNYLNVNWTNIVSVSWTTWLSWSTLAISRRWTDVRDIYIGKFKYFYFKMYNKTTSEYERDFVPCYRKSDSVIWMYDLVNNQFYTNAWTGTFSKGNDVTMSVLKNIYIG